MLKREIARPTTKNWVRRASNRPFSANFNQLLAIFCTPTRVYCTKSLTAMPKRIGIISCIKTNKHPCCITDNDIVEHTAPIVTWNVEIFPGCIACAAHAVLKAKFVNNNNKEEVEELGPPHIISFLINDEYKLVNKPALLRQGCGCCQATNFNRVQQNRVRWCEPRARAPLPHVAAQRGPTAIQCGLCRWRTLLSVCSSWAPVYAFATFVGSKQAFFKAVLLRLSYTV